MGKSGREGDGRTSVHLKGHKRETIMYLKLNQTFFVLFFHLCQ